MAKILVVDDDLANNVVISKALTSDGHTTRTAFTGEEGLKRFAPESFVHLGALAPGAAPVLPALDSGGDLLEIGEQHAVRHEARRPMRDRRRDARVGDLCFRFDFGHG